MQLLNTKDFENFQVYSQDREPECSSDVEHHIEVEQAAVDHLFLQADIEDAERWSFDSPLFDCTSEKSSLPYMTKVYELVKNWDEQDVYDDHVKRCLLHSFADKRIVLSFESSWEKEHD